ncbi:phosphatase PAP2 family protein [Hymenobacter lucidus]|uniref:Phosphatase PAP2 family protein n=1 Tax=Hymenobacter lucidus TaxID=2880930 RepID=A0ABS8AY14_9BACT|nr:phosphatase PAP2 family protein [Hymenobacter lucidus]MCB2410705.1 phosphatase PAP2 family protein [Hymenobacter lucidus]
MRLYSLWGVTRLLWQGHRKLLLSLLLGFIAPWFVFIKVGQEVWEDKGFPGDQAILQLLHRYGSPGQDAAAVWMARAGGTFWTPLVEAAVLLGLLLARQRRAALFFLLSVGGAGALNLFAKLLLARARPALWVSIAPETTYSFPSGHAMGAAALAFTLALLLWPTRGRWAAATLGAAWALLMGWSRMYLGVHFPSDVLAGWVGSVGWVGGIHFLFDRSALDLRRLWSDARTYWLARPQQQTRESGTGDNVSSKQR